MALLFFVLKAVGVTLSGVLSPGAVTAATIAQGTRNRWAGALITFGHAILEVPLIALLIFGLGMVLKTDRAQFFIGLFGGGFLLWMGIQMIREIIKADFTLKNARTSNPILTGFVLSATNPYFLLFWASVGLNLALDMKEKGIFVLVLFGAIHLLCDLIWLSILSFSSYHGANLLTPKIQKWIFGLCGIALAGFGIHFILKALFG
jgi:threonine/homoserine/homoserine lactone efflux protein